MRQAVIDHFVAFTAPLEGVFLWMYQDVKHLITVGIGNLIDASPKVPGYGPALSLPWKHPDGTLATQAEIIAEWEAFKAQPNMAEYPASSLIVKNATTLRLTQADVLALVKSRMLENEAWLKKVFPDWDNWPADAQIAALSMTWAVGADVFAEFGNCKNSLLAGRFHEVTIRPIGADGKEQSCECDISTKGNGGIVPRNAANRLCFNNAQIVIDEKMDPETLFWPATALAPTQTPVSDHGQTLQQQASIAMAEWQAGGGAFSGQSGADISV